jgi:osmotically-inducible protein OsmY
MRISKLIDSGVCHSTTEGKRILAFVAALTVAAALPGCAMFPQSSNPTVDREIATDVQTRFGQSAVLEAPNLLTVQTVNRVVYLNGFASTGLQRSDAESAASQVPGVDKVVNSISAAK